MRKIFTIIILLCGIVGNSWAVCELTESTDRTPSDEDLYPQDPNVSRMALICQKGKCEDGEIVYVGGTHYIGNIFNSKGFTTVNKDDTIYKCKLGGNDKWVEVVRNRTSDDIPVSDDRQDFIRGEPIKEMYLYGKKASDGDYYTNVHYVKPDEKCGVECTLSTSADFGGESRLLLCDNKIFYCSMQSMLWEISNGVDQKCDYVSPEHVASGYTYVGVLKDGYPAYTNKSNAITGMVNENDLCWGCPAGEPFSDGTGSCRGNLGEAWCKWRKNKDGKNTEWKDNECKCNDNGMEWDTEKHDCVKSGKGGRTGAGSTGSGKTGGSGSGKTGGGSSGKGKIGSGKADEKCGVKCNAKNSGKHFYCDGGIYYCYEDSNTYAFLVSINNLLAPCEYTDPLTTVYKTETDFVASYKEANNVKFFGKRVLVNGEEIIPESNDFCMGCRKGLFFEPIDCSSESDMEEQHAWSGYTKYWDFVYGGCSTDGACIDDLDRAWCYWQKVKAKMNVKWSGDNGCKCLDDGKVWDPKTHNCIADTGATTKRQKIDCVIELGASVRCKDGTGFDKTTTLSITSEKCDLYKSNIAKYLNEITQTLCANHGGLGDVLSNQEIKDAAARIDNFMKNAESNASVWKNADGKFNTARLASDATAGVILGTVGGIVSAKVIKKKQLEKGFDVLHCTIGGQTVADWGDEFRVGLGK